MKATFQIRKPKPTDRSPTDEELKKEFGDNWEEYKKIFTIYDPETGEFWG